MNDENSPLLTIAVPTYNGSKTIGFMMDILMPQINDKIEVLISDNASNDGTDKIVESYIEKYPFIKYIRNKKNVGADENFLQCMQMATGKFCMMISDDDILVENSVEKIIRFLQKYPNVSLAYLETVGFKDKYEGVDNCFRYKKKFSPIVEKNICTNNKDTFLKYAQRFFAFTSTFIWSTKRFKEIKNPQKFFGTYFLQGYIQVMCSCNDDDLLGIIKGPIVAVGEYGIIGNYDLALVEGIYNQKLIKYASKIGGYNYKRLENYYVWKICHLGRIVIIKERVAGVKNISIINLLKCSYKYPKVWITLYPFLLIPTPICKFAFYVKHKMQGRDVKTYVNRPTN